MAPHVLKVPRIDVGTQSGHVLLNVSFNETQPKDLKLLATEGTGVCAFECKVFRPQPSKSPSGSIFQEGGWLICGVIVKQRKISTIRARGFSGSDDELRNMLYALLLGEERDVTRHLEVVSRADFVKGDEDLELEFITIIIQKRIEGITERFAEIKLPKSEEEIELFEWCSTAVVSSDAARAETKALKQELQRKDTELKKMKEALEELVKLKDEETSAMLHKFSLLLNEKKLKIRDQQRLLASATVDPLKLEAVEASRSQAMSRSPGPSRKGKRKEAIKPDDDDSDDGFEKMDEDSLPRNDESDAQPRQTPDSTEDEATDDEVQPVQAEKSTHEKALPAQEHVMPPRRELPFTKKKVEPPSKATTVTKDDSETQSDDDEL